MKTQGVSIHIIRQSCVKLNLRKRKLQEFFAKKVRHWIAYNKKVGSYIKGHKSKVESKEFVHEEKVEEILY